MLQNFFIFIISSVSIFLILLILIQRGRGGGLAGAFGGMGGQSAFGAKAGDVFTRATVFAVSIWFCLCIISILLLGRASNGGGLIDQLSDKPTNAINQSNSPTTPNSTTPISTPVTTPISTPTTPTPSPQP
ncbi:MAG: preprotein translocase subunit SecG [Planctomycetaceae bacterium]|jgi:preprotein translocase subunit SecG|nr:preprotein translocase subunit SecG [Planctomycetaceae bacterium]